MVDPKPASGTPAGATITSASLFGANDAASVEFMVLRLNGHVDFARDARGFRNGKLLASIDLDTGKLHHSGACSGATKKPIVAERNCLSSAVEAGIAKDHGNLRITLCPVIIIIAAPP
ncbi:hypothetical protein WN51_09624 [Melipona quadrifasciata]|uniref:Uncharacterized protein n=1 Tax=Melipona quadrifasciata TaxID=166423 RepID=A0A0M8ZQ01_9HYME|nr:hypothetical protein WN51_09624 [Melipona quadrifasciata]